MAVPGSSPPASLVTRVRVFPLLVVVGLLVTTLIGERPAPAQTPPTETFVYLASADRPSDRLLRPETSDITLTGTSSDVVLSVADLPSAPPLRFRFVAPAGQTLRPGRYEDARSPEARTSTRAGVAFGRGDLNCMDPAGGFEIRDIGTGVDGAVERVWLTFQLRCEDVALWFGEAHIAIPDPEPALLIAPRLIQWHDLDIGARGAAIAVNVVPTGGTTALMRSASIEGEDPEDFALRYDTCRDQLVVPGGHCAVWVRFEPKQPGLRSASLVLTDDSGRRFVTEMTGRGLGGRTRVFMKSDAGDYIGDGQSYDYTPAVALITARTSGPKLTVGMRGADGNSFSAEFAPPPGQTLQPGRYAPITDDQQASPSSYLYVSGRGAGCHRRTGEYTVTSIRFSPEGQLRWFAASFEQHCDGGPSALRGVIEFRLPEGEPRPSIPGVTPPAPPVSPAPPPASVGPMGTPREGGRTRFHVEGERDDYVTQGRTFSYSPANATVSVLSIGARRNEFRIDGSDGTLWFAHFEAAYGDLLVPGRHPAAIRYPFNTPAAGLGIAGVGRGCNILFGEFIVHSIGVTADGRVEWFGASFEQHCEGKLPALRGFIEWRVPETDPQPVIPGPSVTRVGGLDRTATAVEASKERFADHSAKAVVLGRSDGYADALAGTPFASRVGGPLLLAPGGPTGDPMGKDEGVFTATLSEISRVLPAPGPVYLLGGPAAISDKVVARLESFDYRVERVAGADRFGTATEIARRIGNPLTVLLADGFNFPDALAAGAAAARADGAVLLTARDRPHPTTDAYLNLHPSTRYAIGGPAARAYPRATPVVGVDRESTAIAVAERFFPNADAFGLARRDGFADALAGGAHIAGYGAPLLLTPSDALHPAVRAWMCSRAGKFRRAYLYGGKGALAEDLAFETLHTSKGDRC